MKSAVKSALLCPVERIVSLAVCHCAVLDSSLPNLLLVGLKCGTLATFLAQYMAGIIIKVSSTVMGQIHNIDLIIYLLSSWFYIKAKSDLGAA